MVLLLKTNMIEASVDGSEHHPHTYGEATVETVAREAVSHTMTQCQSATLPSITSKEPRWKAQVTTDLSTSK